MSTARTLRPRVDFGDDHDAGGALSCLPCCRPDEILHSLVGAPVPPPDARQAVSAHVEEAFSLFAELNEFAGGSRASRRKKSRSSCSLSRDGATPPAPSRTS